jgi:hypothetical protein
MVEYTKQILEKDDFKKIDYKKSFFKEHLDNDNEYINKNLNNEGLYSRKSNKLEFENYTQNHKSIHNEASSSNHHSRINLLENTIKEKEKNLHDLKEENKRLLIEKENVYNFISEEKKKNLHLQGELAKHKDILNENEELKFKLLKITDDYNVMCNKYNRSEHIRYQQSQIIHSLQREIDSIRSRQIQDFIEYKYQREHMEMINKDKNNNYEDDGSQEKKLKDKKPKKKIKKSKEKNSENHKSEKKKVTKRSKSKKRV